MENIFLTDAEYISERLENQIKWYSNKSNNAQKYYKKCQVIEFILASATPVIGCAALAIESYSIELTLLMSAFGAAIAVIESLCKLNKWQNWIQYRYIAELLKHEKYLYITKASPYDDENAFEFLVQRVERTISSENVNWVGLNEEKIQMPTVSSVSSSTS